MIDNAVSSPGPMGWWVNENESPMLTLFREQQHLEQMQNKAPERFSNFSTRPVNKQVLDAVIALQKQDGIDDGIDLSYLWKLLFKTFPRWKAQIIGSCFTAGTMIRMADGSHKQIQDLRLFDQVLTAEGNAHCVTHLFGREANELLYGVTLWGHQTVKMTGEHPVLTRRGYVKANELSLDDYVAVPKYAPMTNSVVQTGSHVHINAQSRRKYANANANAETGRHRVFNGQVKVYGKMPDIITLDKDFGYICGLYLAEGCPDGNKVVWTFNVNEENTLAAKLVELLKEKFNLEASVSFAYKSGSRDETGKRTATPTSCKVSLHSVVWASFFESFLGKLSTHKRLHADAASGPISFLQGLWDGWIDGDGYARGNKTQGTTVSKQLALDMHAIANALGLLPKINSYLPDVSHGIKVRQRRYDVVVTDSQSVCLEDASNCVWRKIKHIETEPFSGKVYNFEVAVDNSYVADGLGVHNCVASGGMRVSTIKSLWEIVVIGDPEETLGNQMTGPDNINHFAPYSYRAGRRIGGLNSGDGSFCEAHIQGFMEYGFLPCQTPNLRSDDFPEPQNSSLYRQWGNSNQLLEQFKSAGQVFDLIKSETITDADQQKVAITTRYEPAMICSSWAFRPDYVHPQWKMSDGTPIYIYKRDTSTSWAHNMSIMAVVFAYGRWWVKVWNSWPEQSHKNGFWFIIPFELYATWIRQAQSQTIGEMKLRASDQFTPF